MWRPVVEGHDLGVSWVCTGWDTDGHVQCGPGISLVCSGLSMLAGQLLVMGQVLGSPRWVPLGDTLLAWHKVEHGQGECTCPLYCCHLDRTARSPAGAFECWWGLGGSGLHLELLNAPRSYSHLHFHCVGGVQTMMFVCNSNTR